jgi:hypothetical protein
MTLTPSAHTPEPTPTPRLARITAARLSSLAKKLTDSDRHIIATLAHGRAATARQLQRLHFTNASPRSNARMAQRVLKRLTDLRVIARLDRAPGGYGGGSAGHVYSLDVAGIKLADPDVNKAIRRPWPLSHLFLEHTLEVMEWYVRLVENERLGGLKVLEYTAEPKSWRSYVSGLGARSVLKPDAFVRLASDEWEDHWFLEIDRDTEHVPALERQLMHYVDYWRSGIEQARNEVFPHVLWIVPNARRYDELIDAFGRLPAEAWPLFQVSMKDDVINRLSGREPP